MNITHNSLLDHPQIQKFHFQVYDVLLYFIQTLHVLSQYFLDLPFQTDEVGHKLFTGYILYFERQALAGVLNVSTSRNLDLGCKFAGSRQKYCCHPGCNQWQLENRQFETTQIKSMQIKIYKIYKFAGSRQKYCCRPPS